LKIGGWFNVSGAIIHIETIDKIATSLIEFAMDTSNKRFGNITWRWIATALYHPPINIVGPLITFIFAVMCQVIECLESRIVGICEIIPYNTSNCWREIKSIRMIGRHGKGVVWKLNGRQ
jgi:hypothetical protein